MCRRDGIGIRARLRGVWGNPCGFKSRRRHHKKQKRGVVRLAEQGRFAVCTEQADHYGGSGRPQHAEKGRKDQLRRGCYRRTAQFQAHSACAGGRHP